jgi:hypothetical protein
LLHAASSWCPAAGYTRHRTYAQATHESTGPNTLGVGGGVYGSKHAADMPHVACVVPSSTELVQEAQATCQGKLCHSGGVHVYTCVLDSVLTSLVNDGHSCAASL